MAIGMAAVVLLLACTTLAVGQDTPPPPDPREAKPERPTVATHAFTVAPGYLELEAGFQRIGAAPSTSQMTMPILFKIGLTDRLQLDIAPGWVRSEADGQSQSGVADTTVGVKWRLADEAPLVGAFAFQPTVTLATGSVERGTGAGTTAVNLLLISSHVFRGVALDVNVGCTRRTGDGTRAPRTAMLWTVSSGIPLTGRLGLAAEVFGLPGTPGPAGSAPAVGFLTGPTFTVTRSLVLDGGAILDITGLGGTTVYAGVTWNIGRAWGPPSSSRTFGRQTRKTM